MQQLYKNLMELCQDTIENKSKFFFVDHQGMPHTGSRLFRVFSYHIASYSDWLRPGALECRGIMFELDKETLEPIRIASRPMAKFFNYQECPFTMDIDFRDVTAIMDKADGSLISTYRDGEYLRLKSKTSIASDQAFASMKWLDKQQQLKEVLEDCVNLGWTVNMEWTAPDNQIVMYYDEPRLVILNIRDNDSGLYIKFEDLPGNVQIVLAPHWIAYYEPVDKVAFFESLKERTGIEGVVAVTDTGLWFKMKTHWYVQLHTNKDSISNPKRLVETVLSGNHDDLCAMFSNETHLVEKIRDFESFIVHWLHSAVTLIKTIYSDQRGGIRKDYAIMGQKFFSQMPQYTILFGVYMKLYTTGLKDQDLYAMVTEAVRKYPELLIPYKYRNEA